MALLDPIVPLIESVEEFNDYPITGRQISRGRIITAVQACPKVWSFKIKIAAPLMRWDQYYGFLEDLRQTNTSSSFTFNFLSNVKLSYLTPYQGTLAVGERPAVLTAAKALATPVQLNLSGLPNSRANVFRKGDFIQITGDTKPYTVIQDVTSSATGTATLTLNRPLFTYPATGLTLLYGNAVTWTCFFSNLPSPSSITPYLNGLQWTASFQFSETA